MNSCTIGSRLVREFGAKNILSECVNGKTYTRVLDVNGDILKERLKMTERTNVGNKKVSTITKIVKDAKARFFPISKTTYDRVYNSDGLLLGSRCKFERSEFGKNLEKIEVSKQGKDLFRQIKVYSDGKLTGKTAMLNLPGSYHFYVYPTPQVRYNEKGLPVNNMSLKQMIDSQMEFHPQRPDIPDLDKLSPMTDLDKYI